MPLTLLAATGAPGCGELTWAPAPFSPRGVEVTYSPAENLTRLRFRVADPTTLVYELAGPGGKFTPIDFGAAPFPSGEYPCDQGTCYQLAIRGHLVPPQDSSLVRSIHSTFGLFAGAVAKDTEPVFDPVQIAARVAEDDRTATVTVTDWMAVPGLERQLRFGLWAEAIDTCDAHPERADESANIDVHQGIQQVPLPEKLSDSEVGRYCVGARPVPRDKKPSYTYATELLLFPLTERHELIWSPTTEVAPLVWRLVTDLEIVDPTRCAQIADRVRSTLTMTLGRLAAPSGKPAMELPLIDLSPATPSGCHHDNVRSLDAGPVADDYKKALAMNYSNRFHRPLLFYLNNLDAPLPQSLVASLGSFLGSFNDGRTFPLTMGLATGAGLMGFPWELMQQYAAIEDPQFLGGVVATLETALPVRSQLHDNGDVIPIMTEPEVMKAAGWRLKICQASPAIERLQGSTPVPPPELTPAVDPMQPPSFRVMLPGSLMVPDKQFARVSVVIRYELCRRFCDNPFRDEAGADHESWATAVECVRNEVP